MLADRMRCDNRRSAVSQLYRFGDMHVGVKVLAMQYHDRRLAGTQFHDRGNVFYAGEVFAV